MDRVFAIEGDWALASDGMQWMLMRRHRRPAQTHTWDPLSFVRSTREVLARCMREKGVEAGTAIILLSGLPETFDEWKRALPPAEAPEK
jgi:hypothetical protein